MAARRRCSTASTPRTPSTSQQVRRAARRRRHLRTSSTRRSSAGLDYYTRTLFEFSSDALGAQSGVGGGGRYDRLIEQLDGPPTPACGWAAGVERMLLAAGELPIAPQLIDLFVALAQRRGCAGAPSQLARDARRAGLAAQLELAGRSLKGQLGHADRIGARYVAIVADGPTTSLKDMESGEQHELAAGERDSHDPPGKPADVKHAPRPNAYRDAWCGQLTAERADTQARVAGWVHRRRDHGGLIFIDLRDRSGIVQLVFHPDTAPDAIRPRTGSAPRT